MSIYEKKPTLLFFSFKKQCHTLRHTENRYFTCILWLRTSVALHSYLEWSLICLHTTTLYKRPLPVVITSGLLYRPLVVVYIVEERVWRAQPCREQRGMCYFRVCTYNQFPHNSIYYHFIATKFSSKTLLQSARIQLLHKQHICFLN